MKRTVSAILVFMLLCSMTSAVAGSAGSASDPLVSQSYVDNTFRPAVIAEGERKISGGGYTTSSAAIPSGYTRADGYTAFSLRANECASLITGASFTPLSGSVSVTVVSGAVIDVSTGAEVQSGAALKANRRYFCVENTSADFVAGSECSCLIDGIYKLGTASAVQTPTPKTVAANNMKIKFNGAYQNMEAYNIDGYTYYKLRDIAALMMGTSSEFAVDFDVALNMIYTRTPGTYTLVGGELKTGIDKSKSCAPSNWKLNVNDARVNCYVYNFMDNNFFKLRDLGAALGFNVDYDDASRTVIINSSDYTG